MSIWETETEIPKYFRMREVQKILTTVECKMWVRLHHLILMVENTTSDDENFFFFFGYFQMLLIFYLDEARPCGLCSEKEKEKHEIFMLTIIARVFFSFSWMSKITGFVTVWVRTYFSQNSLRRSKLYTESVVNSWSTL